jgi:tetratricopeptide (TPR) repeat protein
MGWVYRAVAMGLVVLLAQVTFAQSADDVTRARTHFEAGRALYSLGNYPDAIREFSAGYALVPRPQFLLNLGQAYRKQGDLTKARDEYRKFLEQAPADDPDREQVTQIVAELDQQIAAQPVKAAPVEAVAPAPAIVLAAPVPAEHKKTFVHKYWWIFPAGAAVLAGLSVGIYFAVRPPSSVDCGSASLGCIHTAGTP